jgi:transposase
MTRKEMFLMDQRDRKKLHVVRKVIEKEMTQAEAGIAIDLSDRQIRRLVHRVREEGDRGVCHKGRSKRPNRWKEEKKRQALKIYQEKYAGFGPTLATEKLLERDRIKISKESLRLWLKEAQIPYKSRKKRPHRQWRERRAHCGALVQLDGSNHPWFEDRGPKSVLMAYIDDATGRVFGRFYEYEGTLPAMESFKLYVSKYKLPLAIYADKHTTYKSPAEPTVEEQLKGIEPMSQFERSLKELGVKMIHAHSPQAKGRIERLFGTFQDRVVKEMRLAEICNIQEANLFLETYLPIYNARYNVFPKEKADLHRTAPTNNQLDQALCIRSSRVLKNDFTLSYNARIYQIKENIHAKKVTVEERIDGTLRFSYQGRSLLWEEIKNLPQRITKASKKLIKVRKKISPSPNHPFNQPWKKRRVKTTVMPIT